jgi:hypothetical protein
VSLGEHTRIRAGGNTHWKLKDGEGVVVDFTTGNYFVLDDVCSFFWRQLMAKPQTMPELVSAALEEYEAERAEVAENVRNFCQYVLAEKLAETVT